MATVVRSKMATVVRSKMATVVKLLEKTDICGHVFLQWGQIDPMVLLP